MNRQYAEKLITEAKELNDGVWINHSYNVANLLICREQRAAVLFRESALRQECLPSP